MILEGVFIIRTNLINQEQCTTRKHNSIGHFVVLVLLSLVLLEYKIVIHFFLHSEYLNSPLLTLLIPILELKAEFRIRSEKNMDPNKCFLNGQIRIRA